MNNVGVVIASTGGNKLLRCVRSLRKMEPDISIHCLLDQSSTTYHMLATPLEELAEIKGLFMSACVQHGGFVNGGLNKAVEWMKNAEYEYACLFQDDLVFSPLPEHQRSISQYFEHPLLAQSSGLRFSHFETLTPTVDMRRSPQEWDREDMESEELWQFLAGS